MAAGSGLRGGGFRPVYHDVLYSTGGTRTTASGFVPGDGVFSISQGGELTTVVEDAVAVITFGAPQPGVAGFTIAGDERIAWGTLDVTGTWTVTTSGATPTAEINVDLNGDLNDWVDALTGYTTAFSGGGTILGGQFHNTTSARRGTLACTALDDDSAEVVTVSALGVIAQLGATETIADGDVLRISAHYLLLMEED
jgi:hypothetical protein